MNKIKVLIADDHLLFAEGMEQLLEKQENFVVGGKATDGRQLLQLLDSFDPQLILLDINMPFLNGIETAIEIRKRLNPVKIIFVSVHFDGTIFEDCKKSGANGFFSKLSSAAELLTVITKVMSGENCFEVKNGEDAIENGRNHTQFMERYNLSAREVEIIQLIKSGNSSRKIASMVNRSHFTIETHRKNIFRKLNVNSIAELAVVAIKNNL